MAFHVMLLFIWLATAMDYTDSSLVVRAKLCRLLLQLRDEAKSLPTPLTKYTIILYFEKIKVLKYAVISIQH